MLVLGAALAVLGTTALAAGLLAVLWLEFSGFEQQRADSLAKALGDRTEAILVDTRDLLETLDRATSEPCSPPHLQHMQEAAVTRPHLRAIGHWRAGERLCGVGFVDKDGLRPPRADRIYDSGVIAWWPGPATEVGGLPLFLMRYGDHDAAIDPRLLIDSATLQNRRASLWVDGLRMVTSPSSAKVPEPDRLPLGLSVDEATQSLVSRYQHEAVFPIDIVAVEPLNQFWPRHRMLLALAAALAVGLLILWLMLLNRLLRRQLSPEIELQRALQRGHIVAYFQPIVDFGSGVCVGAEALARWRRDDGTPVAPDMFVAMAERIGLGGTLTLAVLDSILETLPDLRKRRPGFSVNLNLSPADLESDRFYDQLAQRLSRADLPAKSIKLEITERGLVNTDQARSVIRKLRAAGHKVAVDDFGTGYSSLSYLQSFELDILKIDKSFVDAIGTEAATSSVINHVIDMSRSLGLELVAEGVVNDRQTLWLSEHGVRFGQGFRFSPALDAQTLVEYLDNLD